MLSQIRLSSVCRLSVTLVHPTQPVEIFGNFFHHTIAQGLYFSDADDIMLLSPSVLGLLSMLDICVSFRL